MPDIHIVLILMSSALIAIGALFYSIFRYESAIFLLLLSPWIPEVFYLNKPEISYLEEAGPGSYVRIILLIILGVFGLIYYWQYGNTGQKIPVKFYLLFSFIVLAFSSVAYSIDKPITFIRSATFMVFFFFLLGLHACIKSKKDIELVINTIYVFVVIFIIIDLIWLVLFPVKAWSLHLLGRFIGVWGHPNTMGAFCMCAVPILYYKLLEENKIKKIINVVLLLINIYLMILTGSRTSVFGTIIGIIIWYSVQKKYLHVVLTLFIISISAVLLMALKPQSFARGEDDDIVTGRDEFWKATYVLIMEKPLLGYGYSIEGKIWEDPRFYKKDYELWSGSSRTSIHNGYLSITIGVGVIGLLLWLSLLVVPLFKAFKSPYSLHKALVLSIMTMILISNFVESTLNAANTLGTIVFWLAWVLADKINNLKPDRPMVFINE